ncbi:hypothetical protein BCR43DRAFT_509353 [Syncephalastrum racemosum]|uniref:Uncharacterized protein n=1 Tax=Syncephalastrum racemosum TaxID=13706 RepID=A0A1X2HRC8_SYNRA|nr:hypothetical protein BCR43DRAFT_509353 [Syncephalastrum racemosum]
MGLSSRLAVVAKIEPCIKVVKNDQFLNCRGLDKIMGGLITWPDRTILDRLAHANTKLKLDTGAFWTDEDEFKALSQSSLRWWTSPRVKLEEGDYDARYQCIFEQNQLHGVFFCPTTSIGKTRSDPRQVDTTSLQRYYQILSTYLTNCASHTRIVADYKIWIKSPDYMRFWINTVKDKRVQRMRLRLIENATMSGTESTNADVDIDAPLHFAL